MHRRLIPLLLVASLTTSVQAQTEPQSQGQSKEASAPEAAPDIAWLMESLQDEGVSVQTAGQAIGFVPADEAIRLRLDGLTLVDVYHFSHSEDAPRLAYRLAGERPSADVFLVDGLVVIHQAGSGHRALLRRLLQTAI